MRRIDRRRRRRRRRWFDEGRVDVVLQLDRFLLRNTGHSHILTTIRAHLVRCCSFTLLLTHSSKERIDVFLFSLTSNQRREELNGADRKVQANTFVFCYFSVRVGSMFLNFISTWNIERRRETSVSERSRERKWVQPVIDASVTEKKKKTNGWWIETKVD